MTDEQPHQRKTRRKAIPQADLPVYGLTEALRVGRALADEYAFTAVSPLDVAKAIKMQPASGPFRTLIGASQAYGLTEGSAWADKIIPTALLRRVLRPTEEGDDQAARRQAFLKPRVTREFLTKYDRNKVPREDIGRNVLETIGVPASETARVLKQIVDDARGLGLLADINGIEYVQLNGAAAVRPGQSDTPALVPTDTIDAAEAAAPGPVLPTVSAPAVLASPEEAKRVYITHGKKRDFIELLKKFLKYGDMEAVVSVQHETVSLPVPQKVIDDMRRCGAAIIHVDAERTMKDGKGEDYVVINENVLIEIGAAMALYDRRFILLVRDGVQLPSNLQGLSQVRYSGEKLDAEAAMKLLEAIADIKNHPLPGAAR